MELLCDDDDLVWSLIGYETHEHVLGMMLKPFEPWRCPYVEPLMYGDEDIEEVCGTYDDHLSHKCVVVKFLNNDVVDLLMKTWWMKNPWWRPWCPCKGHEVHCLYDGMMKAPTHMWWHLDTCLHVMGWCGVCRTWHLMALMLKIEIGNGPCYHLMTSLKPMMLLHMAHPWKP